mgnify:CR=1 FL=1
MYLVYRTIDSCNPCVGVFYNCKFDIITDSTEDSGTNDLLYCFPREGRDTNKLVAVRGMFLTLSNVMSDIANYPAKMWAHIIIILTRTQLERLCYYSYLCSLDFASLLTFCTASHKMPHEVKVEYRLLKDFAALWLALVWLVFQIECHVRGTTGTYSIRSEWETTSRDSCSSGGDNPKSSTQHNAEHNQMS